MRSQERGAGVVAGRQKDKEPSRPICKRSRGVFVPQRASGSVTSFRMSHEIVPVPRTIMSRHIVPARNDVPGNTPQLPQTRRN